MYIGVDINYGDIASQTATSGGSTTPIATLDYSVPTSSSIIVTLDGVTQVPGVDFNVTSGTTLTFTSSVPATVVVCVYFLGRSVDIGTPGSGTVDSSAIVAGAVDDTHISGLAASKLTGTVAVANGGTGAATHTANNVLIGNGTSAITSVAPSTSGNVLTSNGSAWASTAPAAGGAFETKLLHIEDQKSSGTSAGTFTSGADRTRELNTVVTNEITGASLATNQITLPAGDYYAEILAPAYRVENHKALLWNITTSTTLLSGQSADAASGANSKTDSCVMGRFTLAGTNVLEARHRSTLSRSSNGLGRATSYGAYELYTIVKIWRVG